jgi:hypothetical protein
MANYISSNANRFYAALETAYGQAAAISTANRFPAVQLSAQQVLEQTNRRDKTGSRTFLGTPKTARRNTAFELKTYLTSWSGVEAPSYGPLFQAAMGAPPASSGGLTIQGTPQQTTIQTTTPHGLAFGAGVSYNNEIRFAVAFPDISTITLNAPFSAAPLTGARLAATVTYSLSNFLPSVTLYDYWDPITAVQRVITGAAVDSLDLAVNGDLHEFTFRGPGADIIDSSSFVAGLAGLAEFPAEPDSSTFDYSVVPGHLGQAWIGLGDNQFFTLTSASVGLKNHLELRRREFGATLPRAISPGARQVITNFSLLAQDDTQTIGLYQAARSRTPVPAMLQLGQAQGQLMGLFLRNVMPELPLYDDGQARLEWDFHQCQAQGQTDDELFIAFA